MRTGVALRVLPPQVRITNLESVVPIPPAKTKFLDLCADAIRGGSLVKLTLGGHRGADPTVKNVFVRPVTVRAGARLSFVYRHATRDITKTLTQEEGLACIHALLGPEFLTAHLFTTEQSVELELRDGREPRLVVGKPSHSSAPVVKHDRTKERLIDPRTSRWLHAVGVATTDGRVAKGMEAKFRQINKFVEILQHSLGEAGLKAGPNAGQASTRRSTATEDGSRLPGERASASARTGPSAASPPRAAETPALLCEGPLTLVDMGCGKGYLTFAAYEFLARAGFGQAKVRGIEARRELVELCNRVATENRFDRLRFEAGTIESAPLDRVDVLIALHACDTATDDAIARGIQAGASLIVVAPCCHKELRPQLRPPPALAPALEHGILRERQAEFVTDALRAALLEWAGYDTKVFEFISTEHTAKNLMIAAAKGKRPAHRAEQARRVRELAAFYGIQSQRLAAQLGFELQAPRMGANELG